MQKHCLNICHFLLILQRKQVNTCIWVRCEEGEVQRFNAFTERSILYKLYVCNYLDVLDSVSFDFYWEVWLGRSETIIT